MKTVILCCGEALIDFVPLADKGAFQTYNGGSIYNVAIALGRLGRAVGFLGGLSTDFFGEGLAEGLRESGVDLSYAIRGARPTTLAFVNLDHGEAQYVFVDDASVGRMITGDDLPVLSPEVQALHCGSISLIHDPAGTAWLSLAQASRGQRVVSFDPNIRPLQITDRADYMRRFEALIDAADIVKLSGADLEWLMPGQGVDNVAAAWLERDVRAVVVTQGSAGADLYCRDGRLHSPTVNVDVVDSIGAGDTFMAGLLAFLDQQGALRVERRDQWDAAMLQGALDYASLAASVTVSRAGANPPWQNEMVA